MKLFYLRRIASMLLLILAMTFGMSPLAANAADAWAWPSDMGPNKFKGSGTASDPYLIQDAFDLVALAYMVTEKDTYYEGKYFRQTTDIVLNDDVIEKQADGTIVAGKGVSKAKEWFNIGDYGNFSWDDRFMGIYDGDGHSISGIYRTKMSESNDNYVGLFACTRNARISNLTIKDSYFCLSNDAAKGYVYIGALVGHMENTTITNCHVENTLVQINQVPKSSYEFGGRTAYLGGLVGHSVYKKNFQGTITGCSFDGYICANSTMTKSLQLYAGGIVGYNDCSNSSSYIYDCTSKGIIRSLGNVDNNKLEYKAYFAGIVGNQIGKVQLSMEQCTSMMTFQIPKRPAQPNSAKDIVSGFINLDINKASTIKIDKCANLGAAEYNASGKGEFRYHGILSYNSASDMWIKDCANYNKIVITQGTPTCYIYGTTNTMGKIENVVSAIDLTKNQATISDFQYLAPEDASGNIKNSFYHATEDGKNLSNSKSLEELKAVAIVQALNGNSSNPIWGNNPIEGDYNECPLPRACGGIVKELSGKGTENEPYLINNYDDLLTFAYGINNNTIDNTNTTYYKLNTNIYISSYTKELSTIGTKDHPFRAIFDGNGFQIANFQKTDGALFGEMQGTVKNLALTNYQYTSPSLIFTPIRASAIATNVGSEDGQNPGVINSCYVTGQISTHNAKSSEVSCGGICYAINKGSQVSDCYFYGEFMDKFSYTGTSQIGSICCESNSGQVSNCYGIVTDILSSTQLLTFDGVTNCKNDADAQQLSGKLGDKWIKGYYHPILKDAYHYECTDPDGNKVGLDPITTSVPDNNDILCLEPSAKNMDDATMWKMPNVAVYTTGYDAYMLANATLVDGKPLRFKPAPGHENAPVKGLMNYHFQPESWQMLCLPGEVKLSDLPEGSKLYIGGTLNTDANQQKMNLVEVEAIPAGVPFIAYIGPAITAEKEYIDITMTGNLLMTPQTQEGSSLMGTFTQISSQSDICSSISNNGQYLTPGTEVKPFRAYVNSSQEIGLTDYLLLDEQSYDIEDIINAYATTDADAPRTVNIKMRRKIQAGGWNTLCLPFSLSEEEVKKYFGEDCKLEELDNVSSETTSNAGSQASSNAEGPSLIMKFKTATAIEAGKPYILKVATAPTSDIYDFGARTLTKDTEPKTFTGIQIGNDLSVNFDMMGCYPMVYMFSDENASRFFIQQNTIYRATEEAPVIMNGFRCYLKAENMSSQTAQSLSARMIHGDGSTTSLKLTTVGAKGNGSRIYDLQGVEHTTMQRGINIVGGKKIIKK